MGFFNYKSSIRSRVILVNVIINRYVLYSEICSNFFHNIFWTWTKLFSELFIAGWIDTKKFGFNEKIPFIYENSRMYLLFQVKIFSVEGV